MAAVATTTLVVLDRVPGTATLVERFADAATGRRDEIACAFDAVPDLRPGDPVYTVEEQAFALQGHVVSLATEGATARATLSIDPSLRRRLREGARAVAMEPDFDLGWVLRTLVPPGLREEILDELGVVWEQRRNETLAALKPPLLALLGDVTQVLARTLPQVIARHEAGREAFTAAFRNEIYATSLEPALKADLYPRLEERLGALAGEIGSEIWEKVTVGDMLAVFWSATRESVGASDKDEMARRLRALLERKALPVVRARGPDIWNTAVSAVGEALRQPSVRDAVDRSAWAVVEHPAFQGWIGAILDEWLLRNPELSARFDEALRSRAIREPLGALYKAAEPLLERSLEEVLTRPDRKGMDHQLVRVLRHLVLKKDYRYVLIVDGGGAPLRDRSPVLPGILGDDP